MKLCYLCRSRLEVFFRFFTETPFSQKWISLRYDLGLSMTVSFDNNSVKISGNNKHFLRSFNLYW